VVGKIHGHAENALASSLENQLSLALMPNRKLESVVAVTQRKHQHSANFEDVGEISTYII
jgi:hypothetical protein